MRREQFKLVSAILLLSGFSTGYMQAAPHAAATGVSIVQQDNTCLLYTSDAADEL